MKIVQITDTDKIRKILHGYMLDIENQPARFICVIHIKKNEEWNGEVFRGGFTIEGAFPVGSSSEIKDDKITETLYTLSMRDKHNVPYVIGSVKLSSIDFIEVFSESKEWCPEIWRPETKENYNVKSTQIQ